MGSGVQKAKNNWIHTKKKKARGVQSKNVKRCYTLYQVPV